MCVNENRPLRKDMNMNINEITVSELGGLIDQNASMDLWTVTIPDLQAKFVAILLINFMNKCGMEKNTYLSKLYNSL